MLRAVTAWSPVTITTRMPACRQAPIASGTSARAGSSRPMSPSQHQPLVGRALGARVRSSSAQASTRRPWCPRWSARASHSRTRVPHPCAGLRHRPSIGRRRARSLRSGAPLTANQKARRPPREPWPSSSIRHRTRACEPPDIGAAAPAARARRPSGAQQRHLHGIAAAVSSVRGPSCASLQRTAIAAAGRAEDRRRGASVRHTSRGLDLDLARRQAEPADGHAVFGQGAGLVGQDDGRGAERLDRRQS